MKIEISGKVLDAIEPTKKVLDGSAAAQLKELVANPQAEPAEFFNILPPENIVAMLIASSKTVPTEIPKIIRHEVESLSALLAREFPDLGNKQSFKRAALAAVESLGLSTDQSRKTNEKALKPRSIGILNTTPLLLGKAKPFHPYLRIVLQPTPPAPSFEFFASAGQLSFLVSALAENLAQMLEQRAELASNGTVRIPDPSYVAEMIDQLESSLQKIKLFAPEFGILKDKPITEGPPLPEATS